MRHVKADAGFYTTYCPVGTYSSTGNTTYIYAYQRLAKIMAEHQANQNLELNLEYFSFDEPFMKNLEAMQWNRDNGVVELMPIKQPVVKVHGLCLTDIRPALEPYHGIFSGVFITRNIVFV
ncbi:hypothetical protein GUITHDRAFT_110302 [Guillardia theta CCMP2712]|uniref:Uncharacterized protein n=1 Tax=Guillardia theta (strain CCMP2712) TaxID=905079 RepID=L1J5S8_GUITC|nr:hypothetical protein GUITHDRAFT_110302 [Guillardia theta CCMP2712]EKX43851.1 hypothetical protein GUITHDRAFT_110302 [Guillardia theta CCMP2712]|eukprot:XP_005830831.1 hypothetical protein GUITHDRAFT_110302 [Guillardia theta CCMP2712]